MVRSIATARIVMPKTMVRLSAGRETMTREAQMLCFLAGANSIFYGDKLLTTGNPEIEADMALLKDAGMKPLDPFARPEIAPKPETNANPAAAE
jgi:biotin synthase